MQKMSDPPIVHAVWPILEQEFGQAAPTWRRIPWKGADRTWITHECEKPSPFDPENTRKQLLESDHLSVDARECDFGSVFIFSDPTSPSLTTFPWTLWGRILRLYSSSSSLGLFRAKSTTLYRVFVFAVDRPRQFPASVNDPITPLHINGGYAYPCNRQTIVIYRAEDATRVLLHELQHAACLDDHRQGVDRVEAETEAWAELLHSLLLSHGDVSTAREQLQRQAEWIRAQNRRVRQHIRQSGDSFCQRYTVFKEDVWRRWGLMSLASASASVSGSLRLTPPADPTSPYL